MIFCFATHAQSMQCHLVNFLFKTHHWGLSFPLLQGTYKSNNWRVYKLNNNLQKAERSNATTHLLLHFICDLYSLQDNKYIIDICFYKRVATIQYTFIHYFVRLLMPAYKFTATIKKVLKFQYNKKLYH